MDIELWGDKNPYQIKVDAYAMRRIDYIMDSKYNLEFSTLMNCKREGNTFHLYGAYFPNQENQATQTEFDSADVIPLIAEGYDIEHGNGFHHSHVNLGVTPSGTDENDIKERAIIGGYNASFITNKKGEFRGYIADYDNSLYIDKVPVTIVYPFPYEEYEAEKLALLKEAKTLEEAEEAMEYDLEAHFYEFYPMEDSEIDELEAVIKERFHRKITSYNKPIISKPYNYAGTKNYNHKPVYSMTDEEWEAYEQNKYGGREYYDSDFATSNWDENDLYY